MPFAPLFRCCLILLATALLVVAAEAAGPAEIPGIVFVGGPVVDGEYEGQAGSYHWRDGYVYPKGATNNPWERTISAMRPGKNLFALVPARPDGKLTQLTFLKEGNVFDPEPSFDGSKVLFSMRKDGEDWYHLFEIGIDGSGLRQLTDGPFNDVSGTYLPDGRILFCSDRSGVLDEYHEERSEFLFRMQPDGTGMEQLTFTPGIYFEPTVLQNGLILCSFWDAFHISVAPFIKHETYLITLRPDGTEERPFFGAGEYKFYQRTRHSAIGLTRPGELPDGRILLQSEMGPSIYDPNLGLDLGRALAPIFPPMTSAQTGGTTHTAHLSPLGTRSTPYPLADGRFLLAATLPGSRDFALYAADPNTRDMQPIFDRPNLSEWDPVPVGSPRRIPRRLPDKERDVTSKMATFAVVAGRTSDTPERTELNRRARFVRVLQAEYTAVTTSSHTSLETRILGTVPILPDGSVVFDAPAETPLFLETLDARGNRLVLQAGYMTARAGEVKSCFGCHAPQSEAVPNPTLTALQLPRVQIKRDAGDQSYRRNDPDEYRRKALIGQSSVSRALLSSPVAEARRRGLEDLAQLPDEVTAEDRSQFVALLADPDLEVRRQAAFALAMTGSADELPSLITAMSHEDWVTRHYVAMALEAITGENLEISASHDATWNRWWQVTGSPAKFLERLAAREIPTNAAFARDAWLEAVARTRWLSQPETRKVAEQAHRTWRTQVRGVLSLSPPPVAAIRAAGMLADPEAVALLKPYLVRGGFTQSDEAVPDSDPALARETLGTSIAKEAVFALGRIANQEAVAALWEMLAQHVPDMAPIASRHYQTGPRPEEYTALRALIYAGAIPSIEQVPILIALLPYTEGEKPRFEDRAKTDSQRVLLPRILLERMGSRDEVLAIAAQVLEGKADPQDPLYKAVLAGTNIDRPRSEHGRSFPVISQLRAEQALHLIACLAQSPAEAPEALVVPCLHSKNHRERIEAAVILRRFGFSKAVEEELLAEIRQPYAFPEIFSIGKGRSDTNFRDKAYLMMALAAHTTDLAALEPFTDYTQYYRDIRIGLAIGLGFRAEPDALPLLRKLAGDPIFVVHRLCENAGVEIQDAQWLAGRTVPTLDLPLRNPLKPEYAAPGAYEFAERKLDPVALPGNVNVADGQPLSVLQAFHEVVKPGQYQSVGNTFARNAERMRLFDAALLAAAIDSPAVKEVPLTTELEQAVVAAIDSPFPFAHYLAARFVTRRGERRFAAQMIRKLPEYVAAADTVGFYWTADALGQLRVAEAAPVLQTFATTAPQPRTYGPPGMAYGFSAARALGMLAESPEANQIADLRRADNLWLRAGVLDGLIERGHSSLAEELRAVLAEQPAALLDEEARQGLVRLGVEGD